ncbi:hypothetical protein SDC9_121111 [bioreactor metagenome]|uniref:Uncharacterized protein n=1 Tax=bioreactor metagenome TaxID=1076179 RepID=A0A645CB11_9ZZZZ
MLQHPHKQGGGGHQNQKGGGQEKENLTEGQGQCQDSSGGVQPQDRRNAALGGENPRSGAVFGSAQQVIAQHAAGIELKINRRHLKEHKDARGRQTGKNAPEYHLAGISLERGAGVLLGGGQNQSSSMTGIAG